MKTPFIRGGGLTVNGPRNGSSPAIAQLVGGIRRRESPQDIHICDRDQVSPPKTPKSYNPGLNFPRTPKN